MTTTPSTTGAARSTSSATFAAVGLIVADPARTVSCYTRLGIAFEEAFEGHFEGELPGGLRLTVDSEESIRSFTPGWTRPTGSPRVSLSFRLAEPADVDRTCAELGDNGCTVSREPWDAFWGQRYATLEDPDGNEIDLFADLPQ